MHNNVILKKAYGCTLIGELDKKDKIKDYDAQAEVYPLILASIALEDNFNEDNCEKSYTYYVVYLFSIIMI